MSKKDYLETVKRLREALLRVESYARTASDDAIEETQNNLDYALSELAHAQDILKHW